MLRGWRNPQDGFTLIELMTAFSSRCQELKACMSSHRGFTLIELMTVISIVGILAAVALPQYRNAVIHAREAVLREDLFQFRDVIDQYYVDKGRYPPSLDDLVAEGYLRRIPVDPITGSADWEVVYEEVDLDDPGSLPGIYDVRSGARRTALDGTSYSEW